MSLTPRGANASCTSGGAWCVSLVRSSANGEEMVAPIVYADDAGRAALTSVEEAFSNESHAVWPTLILLDDSGFLAGAETRTSTAYSGGGGSATELHLFQISPDEKAVGRPVLSAPIESSLLIRACFGENDLERRRGTCHDEYGFSGRLSLGPEVADGMPDLTYATSAWAFPRGASRNSDSNERGQMEQGDLMREQDPECRFIRRLRFEPELRGYKPETPLPECSAYTVP